MNPALVIARRLLPPLSLALVLAACSVDRDLPPGEPATGVHPPGMLSVNNPNFHGKLVESLDYDLTICQKCHGEDFAGGKAGVSCLRCHEKGPTDCETCHPGPRSGAHPQHLAVGRECSDCHIVPTKWDDEGHLRRNGEFDPPPAEVTFGALANQSLDPADRSGPPTYADGTCTNVYCHGAVLHAGGGTTPAPKWDDHRPIGGCDQCHGKPPPSHAQSECQSCHRDAPHLDGKLEVGGGCDGCHGSAASPAPPNDLSGNTLTTSLGVGAHQAHLTGASRLRGPIACNECHLVPTAVGDVGHIDTALPAEVFPAGSGTLARTDDANPSWDRIAGTCDNTYCHGGGNLLSADTSSGLVRSPAWTASTGQVYCGSCHGIPPSNHAQNLTVRDCATCHPSVDAFGNPIIETDGTSKHLDGVVDVL